MKTILISRTDAIGDVVLTLPMCGYLKEHLPDCRIIFLAKSYTIPVIQCAQYVDEIINWDDVEKLSEQEQINLLQAKQIDTVVHVLPNAKIAQLCKAAKIKERIGTRNRWFHWIYCNCLVKLSRKKSTLHEAQLNIRLVNEWLATPTVELSTVPTYYGLSRLMPLTKELQGLLINDKFNLIIHPRSRGNGREWSLEKYKALIEQLPADQYRIFISGTQDDETKVADWLKTLPTHAQSVMGTFNLSQFIAFIAAADALIAAGTGPVHVSAALGKQTIGLFPPLKSIHPGRWAPLGEKAIALTGKPECTTCTGIHNCACMNAIEVNELVRKLEAWREMKKR